MSAEGRFGAVVELLNPYLEKHPEDASAWLMLAQHAYWSGQTDSAGQTFEEALRIHANHNPLRLAHARFLMETGHLAKADMVLAPLGRNNAEAETIKGTIAWWRGHLTSAAKCFRNALRLDPDQQEAESGLSSIGLATRPWMYSSGLTGTDTQPLSSLRLSVQGGAFLTPLQAVRIDIQQARVDM
ncbi:MAG TPA: tetratricopeptide repeat protein, partial [Rhodothermales bacterium]|nr:tetratricopeptide repeat protein [Rhodothermales bacterium]